MKLDFPAIQKALLDRLDEVFPDRLPKALTYTDRDVAIAVGTRLVIDKLKDEYARQNKLYPYEEVAPPSSQQRWPR